MIGFPPIFIVVVFPAFHTHIHEKKKFNASTYIKYDIFKFKNIVLFPPSSAGGIK